MSSIRARTSASLGRASTPAGQDTASVSPSPGLRVRATSAVTVWPLTVTVASLPVEPA